MYIACTLWTVICDYWSEMYLRYVCILRNRPWPMQNMVHTLDWLRDLEPVCVLCISRRNVMDGGSVLPQQLFPVVELGFLSWCWRFIPSSRVWLLITFSSAHMNTHIDRNVCLVFF